MLAAMRCRASQRGGRSSAGISEMILGPIATAEDLRAIFRGDRGHHEPPVFIASGSPAQ